MTRRGSRQLDPAGTTNQKIVGHVNGTGPYKLEAWNRGSDVTMTRNDAYWGDKAKNEKLIVRWSKEGAQRLVELQSGTVDGFNYVGYFEVLEAQQQLFPAEISLAQVQLNQLLTVVTLYRALGGGWQLTDEQWNQTQQPAQPNP
jgi:ABC-type transport system substrate-binding protein